MEALARHASVITDARPIISSRTVKGQIKGRLMPLFASKLPEHLLLDTFLQPLMLKNIFDPFKAIYTRWHILF